MDTHHAVIFFNLNTNNSTSKLPYIYEIPNLAYREYAVISRTHRGRFKSLLYYFGDITIEPRDTY